MFFLLPTLKPYPLQGPPLRTWLGVTGRGAHGLGPCKLVLRCFRFAVAYFVRYRSGYAGPAFDANCRSRSGA